MSWALGNQDSNQAFSEGKLHILRKRKVRVELIQLAAPAGVFVTGGPSGSGRPAHVGLLVGHRAARAAGASRLPGPAGSPPRARPTRGFPHVRLASPRPPDVSLTLPFKAPPELGSKYRSCSRQVRFLLRAPPTPARRARPVR